MDNQNITVPNAPLKSTRFLTRKTLFIILGVVVVAEVIWAGFMLTRPTTQPPETEPVILPDQIEKETVISLTTTKKNLRVGENIDVAIDLSSSKKTNGSDLIINYDPAKLTIKNPNSPVIKGSVYSSYPVNGVDVRVGKITVSGISEGGAVMADGLFGVVTFTAKAVGPTSVSMEFSPGSTTDTNVIESETGEDVLERVENLELNIQ